MPRPPTVICYICHREYGTASIGIHEKTCLKKWHENNDKLPPSKRQPEPVRPQVFPSESSGFQQPTGTSGQEIDYDAYNAAALKTSTLPCPKCGRHFETSKLPMHQAHCKPPPRPSRFHDYEARKPDVDLELLHTPLHGKSVQSTSSFRDHNAGFVPCRICGRTFAPDRIERHQENCKATPLKMPSKGADSKTRQRTPPAIKMNSDIAHKLSTACTKCGKILSPGAKFCAQCGQPV